MHATVERKKTAKSRPLGIAEATPSRTFATHDELLEDMDAFRKRVSSTPDAAREFLISAGLLTKNGHARQLIL